MNHHHQQYNIQQQFCDNGSSFYRSPGEHPQNNAYPERNGMKRPRNSPPGGDDPSNDPVFQQISKRFKRLSYEDSSLSSSSGPTGTNTHNGLATMLPSKSDDEISLAEEAQTSPTTFPQHSRFIPQQHPQSQIHRHPYPQEHHAPLHQTTSTAGSGTVGASGTMHATDYQPVNSLLGNLHALRQQQQRRRQAARVQTHYHETNLPQQQQQQRQNHLRHYGNYHLVPTVYETSNSAQRGNRSRKKVVSLRVSSNLY